MRWGRVAAFIVCAACCLGAAVDAKFAASNGEFSGRQGDTCVLCHAPTPVTPSATISIEGLPERWHAGTKYVIQVELTGGPRSSPAPRPQGGFELEASAGHFALPESMQDFLRMPQPGVVTYTPLGTQMRAWSLEWTAPRLEHPPAAITFWLAGVAANGNHLVSGDDGESGDATAHLVKTMRPSEATLRAWQTLPLAPPAVMDVREVGGQWTIKGQHTDPNSTHLSYRFSDAPWSTIATTQDWTLVTAQDPGAIQVRSEGHGRTSPVAGMPSSKDTPLPLSLVLLSLTIVAFTRRTGDHP